MISHLEDGTIHELIDGEIASTALGPIREHLAACAECRARLDAAQALTDETDELVEALDDPATPGRTVAVVPITAARPHAWVRNAAWAASLVIAVGAGYYARGNPADAVLESAATRDARELPRTGEPLQASRDNVPTPLEAARTAETTSRTATTVAPDATIGATTGSAQSDASERREATREVPPASGAAVAPAGRAPTPTLDAPTAALRPRIAGEADGEARRALGRTANQLAARDQLVMKQGVATAPDTIDFRRAVSMMGGRLVLIVGMVPVRLEFDGRDVRVIYRVNEGELVLAQSVEAGVVSHRLLAPPGFPADSLAALRARVRE